MNDETNVQFKIEKGVVVPKGDKTGYPFDKMELQDSFLVPDGKRSRISSLASYYGNRYHKRFLVRTVEGGVRVWRIQ